MSRKRTDKGKQARLALCCTNQINRGRIRIDDPAVFLFTTSTSQPDPRVFSYSLMNAQNMNVTSFRTLGRSGLVVSPLALGTMTFGTARWGSSDEVSESIFNTYIDAGGNFVDTANVYAGGRSEELVGQYIANRNLRDKVVLATKFAFNTEKGNPHAGGNGRKNLYQALDKSLCRLKTDYVDLYWMHVWDMVTPVEEMLQSLGDLVRSGKIRYFGFSDMPAWYATKAATLAQVHHVPGPIAMQLEYSLVERTVEQEYIPAARECGMGICPWSPLAAGFLAGKYSRQEKGKSTDGRLSGANPFGDTKFTDRNFDVLDTLRVVATEVDRPLAQVALAWVVAQPGVSSTILGVSKLDQLHDNIAALEITLTAAQLAKLNQSTVTAVGPYGIFSPNVKQGIFGGFSVQGWS